VPEKTKYKLDNMKNDMKEKTQYDEQDRQTDDGPNPYAEIR
jgi:hypothetical protein